MFLKPKANAKDLWDIDNDIAMEVLLRPNDEETPCPWDADISVEGTDVIIEGGLAPGGIGHGETCTCTVPIKYFTNYYTLELPESVIDTMVSEDGKYDSYEQLLSILDTAGWEEV